MAITEVHKSENIISAMIAVAFAFIIASLIFMNITYGNTKENIIASMHEIERQNVLVVKRNLDLKQDFASTISINMGITTGDLGSAEAIRYIRQYSWFADFGAFYLINKNGNMSFGTINSEAERDYYIDLMSQNIFYSDIKIFNSGMGHYLVVSSPVRHNNKTIGFLSVRLYRNKLNQLLTFDIFKGTGYCYLISKDGYIVARSNHSETNRRANTLRELFPASKSVYDETYYTTVADAMGKGASGEMIFYAGNDNRVISYVPVGVADMYLVTSVPENVVFSAAKEYIFRGLAFVLVSMAIFGVFMYYFFNAMKKKTEIIKSTNRELSLVYDNMPGGILRYVFDGKMLKIKSANKGFFDIISCSEEVFADKYGNSLLNMTSVPLSDEQKTDFRRKIERGEPFETEARLDNENGDSKWVSVKVDYVNGDNCLKEMVVMFSDITNIKTANQKLSVSKEQFDIVKRLTNIIFFEWNIKTGLISHSSNFLDFFIPMENYENFPYSLEGNIAFSQEDARKLISLFEQLKAGLKESSAEFRIVNKSGDTVWYKVFMSTIFDESGKSVKVVGLLTDIDEQKRELLSAEESAMKDPLTQLYNKRSTKDLIESYISSTQSPGVLMMVDVDDFKHVNDRHGHLYGDAVLSEFAYTLKSFFRDSDIVGRIGGDEFLVFMTNVRDITVVQKKAENIQSALNISFCKNCVEYNLSCSMGISLYPSDGTNYETLVGKADQSLYFSKNSGKKQYNFYSDSMNVSEKLREKAATEITEINSTPGLVQKNFRENVAEYILKLFYQHDDIDKVVSILFDLVGKSFGLGRLDLSLFSEDEKYFEILYEWCEDEANIFKVEGKKFEADEWSLIKPYLDEDNILVCNDFENAAPDCLKKKDIRDRGLKSAMLCYIVERDKRKAVLVFEHLKKKHVFTQEEMDTIRTISNTISLFVLRARERLRYYEKEAQMKNWEIILDETDDIVYVSDVENYELLYLNKAGRERPRLKGKKINGGKCYEFFSGIDKPCSYCTMHLLSKDKYYVWEWTDPDSGDHYLLKDKLLEWNGRLARIEWAINLTERHEQQEILSLKLKTGRMLLEGIKEMTSASDFEESMDVILKCIANLYKADRSYIMRVNGNGHTISMTNEWLAEGIAPEINNLQDFPIDRSPLWNEAFTKQKSVFLNDISKFRESHPEEYERLAAQGIIEVLAIPIKLIGRLWGFLGVDAPREHIGDMYVLESVAYFVADEINKRNIIEMKK